MRVKLKTEKEDTIAAALTAAGIEFEREHKGIQGRQFRFDFAIIKYKIAIEYEGNTFGKSRHTSPKGYSTDCKKYNLAAINGWAILRYTTVETKEPNWTEKIIEDINELTKLRVDFSH